MTAAGRAKREAVRFGIAEMFEQGVRPPEVARRLRVSRKSGYAWHVAWREGGRSALASKGPGGFPCQLSDDRTERHIGAVPVRRRASGPAISPTC
ncbi:helix-turn-helix domain-containing protein [Streptomyces sp. NPDC047999]|uniref:helix-turn-helix domain-containing protein n=1 Tax=Streptomyces sp. NPDC047999 TaxID=3365497 RepID=UPI0037136FEC